MMSKFRTHLVYCGRKRYEIDPFTIGISLMSAAYTILEQGGTGLSVRVNEHGIIDAIEYSEGKQK